jgi:hypothetical protein
MRADRDDPRQPAAERGHELPPPTRQARLKREFADRYPGLDPGVWYPAAMVAEFCEAWLARHPRAASDAPRRLLDPEHFDFRGGVPRGDGWPADAASDERNYLK